MHCFFISKTGILDVLELDLFHYNDNAVKTDESKNCLWLGVRYKESCKGHCNGPLVAVVHLKHFRQGSKRPEHHI